MINDATDIVTLLSMRDNKNSEHPYPVANFQFY